jgi:hypothetical protein
VGLTASAASRDFDGLAHIRLDHLRDEFADAGIQQSAGQVGEDLEHGAGVVLLDAKRQRDADGGPAAANQLDALRLVVAGHPPVNGVAEALDLDA